MHESSLSRALARAKRTILKHLDVAHGSKLLTILEA